jgi:hypothetical protein
VNRLEGGALFLVYIMWWGSVRNEHIVIEKVGLAVASVYPDRFHLPASKQYSKLYKMAFVWQ